MGVNGLEVAWAAVGARRAGEGALRGASRLEAR
jgi:hypothetical protein